MISQCQPLSTHKSISLTNIKKTKYSIRKVHNIYYIFSTVIKKKKKKEIEGEERNGEKVFIYIYIIFRVFVWRKVNITDSKISRTDPSIDLLLLVTLTGALAVSTEYVCSNRVYHVKLGVQWTSQ